MKTITFRVGKKEGPTAQHRGLYQIFGDRTLWKIGYYAVQQKLIEHYKSTIIFLKKFLIWRMMGKVEESLNRVMEKVVCRNDTEVTEKQPPNKIRVGFQREGSNSAVVRQVFNICKDRSQISTWRMHSEGQVRGLRCAIERLIR